MGNTSSVFYPDNPKRLRRAQQLGDDCKYAQDQYDSAKKQLEMTLGPYKEKLDKVLKAFGCSNIDDFDQLVLKTATGDALTQWNRTRENYDKAQIVDQVIMAAEGIVTIVGFTVSIIGAAAGGFGFFAGIAVTADILLLLGVIGALFDIINGAIQRDKLRDAINSLVPTRIKAKYCQMQMEVLLKSLPAIQVVYQAFEEMGYDKDKILQKFKDGNWLKSLRTEATKITYQQAGQELADMDSQRGAWTNEDPDWRQIAGSLDAVHLLSTNWVHTYSATHTAVHVTAPNTVQEFDAMGLRPGNAGLSNPAIASVIGLKEANQYNPPPAYDGELLIRFMEEGLASVLQGIFHIILQDFEGDSAVRVLLNTKGDRNTLVADIANNKAHLSPAAPTTVTPSPWIVRFANPADAAHFTTHGKGYDANLISFPDSVEVRIQIGDLYLTEDGSLTMDWQQPSTILLASYA